MSAANEIASRAPACAPPKKKHGNPHGEHKPAKHKHHGDNGDNGD
jgi:hypothetical protein